MTLFIGVDGGGTSTDVALVDESGVLRARTTGPTTNQSVVGFETAVERLVASISDAVDQANIHDEPIHLWVGMAGADRDEDRKRFTATLGDRFDSVRVTNDAALVLSATPDGHGIALIAGTGSIAYASSPNGQRGRSGGWGHIFGDEGSAYGVAVDALRAVAADADGRGPSTRLTHDLLQFWNADRPQQLITRIYASDVRKPEIAASAPTVVRAAEDGDPVALAILGRAADALGNLVNSLLSRIAFPNRPRLAATGGMLLNTTILRDRLVAGLDADRIDPEIQLVDDIALSVAHAVRRFHHGDTPS